MMGFKSICLGPEVSSFADIVTDDAANEEPTNTVKIGKILEKNQHNLGEYSCEEVMRTKIDGYNDYHQRSYDQYMGFINKFKVDESQEEKTIRVTHYFFDVWTMDLAAKLDAIRTRGGDDPGDICLAYYEFTDMVLNLMKNHEGSLEGFLFLRNLIEFQFTRTKTFYSRLLMVYFFCMILFIYQMHWATGSTVLILNTI